jgi:hypothetical protein
MSSGPESFDVECVIPEELVRGKSKVTVRVQADDHVTAGGVCDLRIVLPHGGQ